LIRLIRLKKEAANTNPLPDEVRDYRLLMERWLTLVNHTPSLDLSVYGEAEGYPLIVVRSECHDPKMPSIYLSAGIHGDEPAAVEGLIRWAETSLGKLARWNWMIFPCLNPWGLERNIRFDALGRDLNRFYDSKKVPQIVAQLALMKARRFDFAVTLHEDYDARGFYLYEVAARRPHWGELLCAELISVMDADPRRKIDGHSARNGLIRRKIKPDMMKGHPEAFLLHFQHAARTFTIETPSEKSLNSRVRLQERFLAAMVKKIETGMVS
jgi:hypothetical protein